MRYTFLWDVGGGHLFLDNTFEVHYSTYVLDSHFLGPIV